MSEPAQGQWRSVVARSQCASSSSWRPAGSFSITWRAHSPDMKRACRRKNASTRAGSARESSDSSQPTAVWSTRSGDHTTVEHIVQIS